MNKYRKNNLNEYTKLIAEVRIIPTNLDKIINSLFKLYGSKLVRIYIEDITQMEIKSWKEVMEDNFGEV
ncbi:MAG: hypothetical protein FJW56_04270 [Actinobacteria bacterium]|nr:hypothetical protein [Actinomycetota bacterium]